MTNNVKTNGFHFIASRDCTIANPFKADAKLADCEYAVFVNNVQIPEPAETISFNSGDDVLITFAKGNKYPVWPAVMNAYIGEFVEPLPPMFTADGEPVTDVNNLFHRATLTKVHPDLFAANPNIKSFKSCFLCCVKLEEIPADLFKYNAEAEDFAFCFGMCESLKEIPSSLFINNLYAYDFLCCFMYCTSLKEIPMNLFKFGYRVKDLNDCFKGCELYR